MASHGVENNFPVKTNVCVNKGIDTVRHFRHTHTVKSQFLSSGEWAATPQRIKIYILNKEKHLINTGGKIIHFPQSAEKRCRLLSFREGATVFDWVMLVFEPIHFGQHRIKNRFTMALMGIMGTHQDGYRSGMDGLSPDSP